MSPDFEFTAKLNHSLYPRTQLKQDYGENFHVQMHLVR